MQPSRPQIQSMFSLTKLNDYNCYNDTLNHHTNAQITSASSDSLKYYFLGSYIYTLSFIISENVSSLVLIGFAHSM